MSFKKYLLENVDEKYLELANSFQNGDKSVEEELRKMVDDAARNKNLILAWRAEGGEIGSQNLSRGFYNTDNKKVAEFFAGNEGKVMRVALILGKTQKVYESKDSYDSLEDFRNAEADFQESSYDSISAIDIPDGPENSNVYVVKKKSQIKSAEIFTLDSSKNIIPLSQRFNKNNPDIRY